MKIKVILFVFGFLSEFGSSLSSLKSGGSEKTEYNSRLRQRRDTSSSSYFYYQEPQYPRDCQEVYEQCGDQDAESGVFMIQPDNSPEPFMVFCNNSIDGGGWTVIQRRVDGSVDFYRTWNEYKQGFGFLKREFWLGNDQISDLTNQKDYELRIDMNNANGVPYFAKYDLFRISDEWSKYRMVDLGGYLPESTANHDSLAYHRDMSFTTYNSDNDRHSSYNCADNHRNAWWYNGCDASDLNSNYFAASGNDNSIEWNNLPGGHYNLKFTEMKIRPI
ncbi:hypothetical protein BSL78_23224 [Apostichopus japonicus]|uniref:Fibrinogen C-terminal domain-containing protein n=1 Tax=Stichopus japonicus TaxID=307972 RepID=A0A2G8JVZ9_STIJA|nr:hypothetical protein BSL78_23224 [Apostichopus japonicus]